MTVREPEIDPELDWLRRGHRSERASDALRRRALAVAASMPNEDRAVSKRAGWLGSRWPLAFAALAVWFGVTRYAMDDERGRVDVPRAALENLVPGVEPNGPRRPSGPGCPQPLPTSPWDPSQIDMGSKVSGFEVGVFDVETKGCGPLTRRYLVRMPAGDASSAPLLIMLHDGGRSPDQTQVATRWWFNDLTRRERAVLVYANGGPSTKAADALWMNAGVWQTDETAHPAVDDVEYLRGVVADVRMKRGLAPTGDVFLAGHGSGGLMALAAAARHPERYAGVAAFLPSRSPAAGEFELHAPSTPGERRLRAVYIALTAATGSSEDASALAWRWASAFESKPGPVRVSRQEAGIERVDTSFAGSVVAGSVVAGNVVTDSVVTDSVALRVVRLSAEVDPFPGPGGDDPLARAASERRPFFFNGPGAAWAFLRQPNP